jgi:hypothetical protein
LLNSSLSFIYFYITLSLIHLYLSLIAKLCSSQSCTSCAVCHVTLASGTSSRVDPTFELIGSPSASLLPSPWPPFPVRSIYSHRRSTTTPKRPPIMAEQIRKILSTTSDIIGTPGLPVPSSLQFVRVSTMVRSPVLAG